MREGIFSQYVRIFLISLLVWLGGSRVVLLYDDIVPAQVRDDIAALPGFRDLAGKISELHNSTPLAGILAALGLGIIIEQTGLIASVQSFLSPPLPAFLAWPKPNKVHGISPWRRRPALIGRHDDMIELKRFLRSKDRSIKAIGYYGDRGVGKTRLIIEALAPLRWRLLRPIGSWHVGRLVSPIPIDTRFRRRTAILIDYAHDAEIFWQSADALLNTKHGKSIRLIFESPVDFGLMVGGRAGHKVAPLRKIIHDLGEAETGDDTIPLGQTTGTISIDPVIGRAEPRSISDSAVPNPARKQAQASTGSGGPRFRQLAKLADPGPRLLVAALNSAARPRFWQLRFWRESRKAREHAYKEIVLGLMDGRPYYASHLSALVEEQGPAAALANFGAGFGIDAGMVPREEAEMLIEEAVDSFPEEGLELLLLAAFGQGAQSIDAESRNRIAPGSNDQRRLSRVFRNYGDSGNQLDLRGRAPTISDAQVAYHTLVAILARLQNADITDFARKISRSEDIASRHFHDRLAEMLRGWWPYAREDDAHGMVGKSDHMRAEMLGVLIASQILCRGDTAVDDAIVAQLQKPPFNTSAYSGELETDELVAVRGLAAMAVEALTGPEAGEEARATSVNNALATHLTMMLDGASKERRATLLRRFVDITPILKPEIKLFLDTPEWSQSRSVAAFLRLALDLPEPGETTAGSALWLCEAIGGEGSGDSVPAAHEDAMAAFQIMDRCFRASFPSAWDEAEEALIERLLRGSDPVGQMAATWAIYWYVRPTDLEAPRPISSAIEQALWALVNSRDTISVVWKRAAASVAKLILPASEDDSDIMMSWARTADGTGGAPLFLTRPVSVAPSEVTVGRDRANRLLADSDAAPDVRRAAALLALALAPPDTEVPAAVIDGIVESVLARGLVQAQHETFLIRLAHIRSPLASSAIAGIIRKYDSDARVAAFLALAVTGKLDQLDAEDLGVVRDRDEYYRVWRRLQQPPAPDAATETGNDI